ncbi:MAG: D-alanine--D-alanine ligase [Planctomycetes bacterium]|nr:D-alanine--D-alanine ligase [Planctomycetota bacterium]
MRLGLTYDLRSDWLAAGHTEDEVAEFDRDDTIDALEAAATAAGFEVERIGRADRLIDRLREGRRWDLVLNIAEGLRGLGRESLVPALLDAHGIPYVFSDPLVCALTLHKGAAKRFVRDQGLPTPDFVVLRDLRDLDRVDLPFPLFAKPIAEGSSKGVRRDSKCRDLDALRRLVAELLARHRQPVLVETFLPGREVTVGILGTGDEAVCAGVLEVKLRPEAEPEIYTYENKERCEELVEYVLADGDFAAAAARTALRVWRALGCRDGGRVDLRADADGRLAFLEVNPLPGLHPEHSDLPILCALAGMSYGTLIGRILASALRRLERREIDSWTS